MKRFYIKAGIFVLIISGLISGCSPKHADKFQVSVVLQHAPLQEVYLDEMRLSASQTVDTDKIQDASGRFSFAGITPEEELYRIRFGSGGFLLIAIAGGDHISITGDYTHLDQVKIAGSPASTALTDFLQELNRQANQLGVLSQNYAALKAAKAQDSLLTVKGLEIVQQKQAMSGSILSFARTSQSPATAVFALSLLQTPEELQAAKPVFDSLTKRFPHSMLAQSLVDEYTKFMNNSGATAAPAISVGSTAPEISFPDPEGKVVSLSSLRGKYVLVDFWASWCGPCRQENPNVVKAYNAFHNKNFTILGVSLDTKKDAWIQAIKDDKLVWNQVSDLKGWDSAPAAAYGVEAIPANFLLDPSGKVIATDLRGSDLENTLGKLLK